MTPAVYEAARRSEVFDLGVRLRPHVTRSVLTTCPDCALPVKARQIASHRGKWRCRLLARQPRLVAAGYVPSVFNPKEQAYRDFVRRLRSCGFRPEEVEGSTDAVTPTCLCELGTSPPGLASPGKGRGYDTVWVPAWLELALDAWERDEPSESVGEEVYSYNGAVFGRRRFGQWVALFAARPELRGVVVEVCAVTGAPGPANGYGEVLRHTLDTLYDHHRAEVEAHIAAYRDSLRPGCR